MIDRVLGGVRGLVPVFGIAVAVALLGTATGFAWDRVHRVVAEEQVSHGTPAVVKSADIQQLSIGDWGVSVDLPLAAEMPLLSYAVQSADVIGLSSADLEKFGPDCRAGRNALGTVSRYQVGSYGKSVPASAGSNVVASIGAFDYVYQFPQTACADQPGAMTVINREMTVVLEALGNLAPASN